MLLDRLAQVEDRVEHQLLAAPLGADDQVVAFAAAVERLVDHAVDDQHGNTSATPRPIDMTVSVETRARC